MFFLVNFGYMSLNHTAILRLFDDPPFVNVEEALDCIRQLLQV